MIAETDLPRVKDAALRIMKSVMRKHIYETKSKEDSKWSPMLVVEEGFYQGAEREWLEVHEEFKLDEAEAKPLLEAAFKQAASDLTYLMGDTIPEVATILKNWDLDLAPYAKKP